MTKTSQHNYKPIIVILFVSAVITTGYLLASRTLAPTPVGINEVTSDGTVALYASPTTVLIRPNVERSMAISVTSTDRLTAVQLEISYDPTNITITDFANSGILANTLSGPTNSNGVIKATFGADLASGGISGNPGAIAWFKLKALRPGTSTISFGQSTLAAVTSRDGNALKEVNNSTVQALYPGDINGDNRVDIFDYTKFVTYYNDSNAYSAHLADLNTNGNIDIFDYTEFVKNFGKTYP